MRYIKTSTTDEDEEFSGFLVEIDGEGMKVRRLEISRDGTVFPLSKELERPGKSLSREPMPTIDEINDGGIYEAEEISGDVFEKRWHEAVSQRD